MNKSKHYITTLGGAIILVWAFTASSRAQKYSDWSAPINLGPTVNSTSMDRGPAISKDGLSLYFASSRPDGFGGEDIYVSQRESQDSEWGPPANLGPIINTSFNESVPAFSRDGHLLFFSSNQPVEGSAVQISGSPGATTRTTTSPGNRRRIWEQGLTLRLLMPAPVTSTMMRWA